MAGLSYLTDTNILLRLVQPGNLGTFVEFTYRSG